MLETMLLVTALIAGTSGYALGRYHELRRAQPPANHITATRGPQAVRRNV